MLSFILLIIGYLVKGLIVKKNNEAMRWISVTVYTLFLSVILLNVKFELYSIACILYSILSIIDYNRKLNGKFQHTPNLWFSEIYLDNRDVVIHYRALRLFSLLIVNLISLFLRRVFIGAFDHLVIEVKGKDGDDVKVYI